MVDGPEGADSAALAQALSAFKDRGSNLLIVGSALGGAHPAVCDRLLGEAVERPRRRVFVRAGATTDAAAGPRASSPRTARLVTRDSATRSVEATAPEPDVPSREVADRDLDTLAAAVDDAVADLRPPDGFEPAELRVCFDSLRPLFADGDERAAVHVLDRVTRLVRRADGMGHYHLPVDRDAEPVGLVAPLFDAVIDLRVRDGTVEHSWSLVDRDVESEWLRV